MISVNCNVRSPKMITGVSQPRLLADRPEPVSEIRRDPNARPVAVESLPGDMFLGYRDPQWLGFDPRIHLNTLHHRIVDGVPVRRSEDEIIAAHLSTFVPAVYPLLRNGSLVSMSELRD